jgi:hypothetical protein
MLLERWHLLLLRPRANNQDHPEYLCVKKEKKKRRKEEKKKRRKKEKKKRSTSNIFQ